MIRGHENDTVEGAIIHRGWVKFIAYDPSKTQDPDLKFFENSAFGEVNKKKSEDAEIDDDEVEDDFGSIEVPAKTSFWMILTSHGLHALSERRNDIA